MIEIKGTFSTAKVFTDNIEETALSQIQQLCSQPFVKDCKIRIMPDVHSGVGCVISFTANLGEMVIPNIVGVDIGCGMLTVELGNIEIDFESLICTGKGNEDWNCSAPHGAGRLMSRTAAFESLSLDEFEKQIQGIYSTSVTERTLDESPMAYKNKDEIVANISPMAEIVKTIKPVYNFKAS